MKRVLIFILIILALTSICFAGSSIGQNSQDIIGGDRGGIQLDRNKQLTQIKTDLISKTKEDIFTGLISTKVEDTQFVMNNPSDYDMPKDYLNLSFNEVCGHVINYTILVWQDCVETLQDCEEYTRTDCYYLSNDTKQQYPICDNVTYNFCTPYEWEGMDYCESDVLPAGETDYKIVPNVQYERCKDGTYGYQIDWIPSIQTDGIKISQNDWAWWNGTINLTDRLVAYFNFSETSGNINSEVNGYTGTITGTIASTTGIVGNGRNFSGLANYFTTNIPTAPFANANSESINAWYKATHSDYNDTYSAIISVRDGNVYPALLLTPDHNISGMQAGTQCYTPIIEDGQWHMYTQVYNNSGTNRPMYLYVDGVKKCTGNITSNIANSGTWYIGSEGYDLPGRSLNGSLDELGLWNRTLNQTDINALYNNGAGHDPFASDACTPSLTNTSWGAWSNLSCVSSTMNQTQNRTQYDANVCGGANTTFYQYQTVGPSYLNTSYGAWTNLTCAGNFMNQTQNKTQYDSYGCAANTTYFNYQTLSQALQNTSWGAYTNLSCVGSNMNQSRNLTQYDLNTCTANVTYYSYQSLAPIWANTSYGAFTNLSCAGSLMNQTQNKTQYDLDTCGTNTTFYNYQTVGPSYLNTSYGAWSNVSCQGNNMNQTQNKTQYDSYGCAANTSFFNYQLLNPIYINTSYGAWTNLTCLGDNTMNQSRNLTQYDGDTCAANSSFFDYRHTLSCSGSCNPNLLNTSWGAWSNLSCAGSVMNQSSNLTQYDSNNCGGGNTSFFQYQTVGPSYLNTSYGVWSNLSCLGNNMNQSQNKTQYDTYGCAANSSFFNYQLVNPIYINTSYGAWTNLTCLADNTMNQTQNLTQYDADVCAANQTFFNYQHISSCTYSVNIMFNSPLNNAEVTNSLSTTLNVSFFNGFNQSSWYSWNGGIKNYTLCTMCNTSGNKNWTTITVPRQGFYNITVWANNTAGTVATNTTNSILVSNRSTFVTESYTTGSGFGDTWVDPTVSNQANNYQDATDIDFNINNGLNGYPYLKFNITSIFNKTYGKATLSIYESGGYQVVTSCIANVTQNWNISKIIYGNKPTLDTTKCFSDYQSTMNGATGYITWTITDKSILTDMASYTIGNQSRGLSFNITVPASSNGVTFYSNESNSYPIQLNISTYSGNIKPIVTINTTNNSNFSTQVNLTFNVSDDNDYISNVSLYLDGSLNSTGFYNFWINTSINNTATYIITPTAGSHNYYFTTCDSDGLCNTTPTYTFYSDQSGPVINLVNPADGGGLISNVSIKLNYTVTDYSPISACWYQVFNISTNITTNVSLPGCTNITFNISQGAGTYNITIWSNDSFNNLANHTHTFSVSLGAPGVTLNSPDDSSYLNATNLNMTSFNWTALSGNGISACQIWANFTGVWALNKTRTDVTSGTMANQTMNLSGLADGSYKWNVWCNDTLNNGGFSVNNRTFTIDTIPPQISILYITTSAGSQNVNFNWNVIDSNKGTCLYYIQNSTGGTEKSNTIIPCTGIDTPYTLSNYGSYTLFIQSTDLASNTNSIGQLFTAGASSGSSSSGGGGGGGGDIISKQTVFDIVNQTQQSSIICGNGVCQKGEDPASCPNDCQLNIDEVFCTIGQGTDCPAWVFSWATYGLIGIILFVLVRRSQLAKRQRARA